MTNEASDTTRGETQHNDDVEYANVNTEFERVCCNYSEQLAGKCFTFNPATILNSIKLSRPSGMAKIYLGCIPWVSPM